MRLQLVCPAFLAVACQSPASVGLDAASRLDAGIGFPDAAESADAGPEVVEVVEVGTLGPRGGRLLSVDGRARVTVPERAFLNDVALRLRVEAQPSPGVVGPVYCLTADAQLQRPLVAAITLDADLVPGTGRTHFRLATARTSTDVLVPQPESRGLDGRTARGLLSEAAICFGATLNGCGQGEREGCFAPERCLVDEDDLDAPMCGVPCRSDSECPSPLYCVAGGCRLGACATDEDCLRGNERCVDEVCAPSQLHKACSSDSACGGEQPRCYTTRSRAGFCAESTAGCPTASNGCSLRTEDALEGFYRVRPTDSRWDYGYRNVGSAIRFLGMFEFHDDYPFLHWGASDTRLLDLAIGVNSSTAAVRFSVFEFPPGRLYSTPVRRVIQDADPVLRYRVPRRGKYLVKVAAQTPVVFLPDGASPLFASLKVEHISGSNATSLIAPNKLTIEHPATQKSATTTVSAQPGDTFEVVHSTIGGASQVSTLLLQVDYVYLGVE